MKNAGMLNSEIKARPLWYFLSKETSFYAKMPIHEDSEITTQKATIKIY